MEPRRPFAIVAIAAATCVGLPACGGGDDEPEADPGNPPAGTYSGRTAQKQRVTLTVKSGAVRTAKIRLKGSGAVIQGSQPCAARVNFTESGGAEIGNDGRFEIGPVRKAVNKPREKTRSTATLKGRFDGEGGVRGTFDYKAKSTITTPAEELFSLEGSKVTTPAQKLTLRCEGKPVKFSAKAR